MKFLAVFVSVIAAASAMTGIITLDLAQIEEALMDPYLDPAMKPILINSLNTIVANLHAGIQQTSVTISLPVSQQMTAEELAVLLHSENTNPAFLPYIEAAYKELLVATAADGAEEQKGQLNIPAMEVNIWNLQQLSDALSDPELDPELEVYLTYALNRLIEQLFSGIQITEIPVITPPGVVAHPPTAIVPEPAIVQPIDPTPVVNPPRPEEEMEPTPVVNPPRPEEEMEPTPVVNPPRPEEEMEPTPVVNPPRPEEEMELIPTPVITPPRPQEEIPVPVSAPLVQLIINVNAQAQQPTPVVNPSPVVDPFPVIDSIDEPIIAVGPWPVYPETVIDEMEEPIIAVGPWPVFPVAPEHVIDEIEEPIIAVGPWVVNPVNPIPEPVIEAGEEHMPIAVGPWVIPEQIPIAVGPWGQ